MPTSWDDFYHGEVQGLYALIVVPAVFLGYLLTRRAPPDGGVEPRASRFVHRWAIIFLVETLLDPIATGPLLRWLELGGVLADNAMVPFVLLGDYRVFLLLLAVASPERPFAAAAAEAAAWTLLVPCVAGTSYAIMRVIDDPPSMMLWLVYESAFAVLALVLRARWVRIEPTRPAVHAYLRALLAYVALYYALWAAADLLILTRGLDVAWAMRAVANQLYYAFWVPFAYVRFFAARYASTSSSVQTAR